MYRMIDEHRDGRFCLRNNISVEYPGYGELFNEVMDFLRPVCELLILPVEVNECMDCTEDLRKVVCAFRVADDVIEIFSPDEGLREFERILRRVVDAGKITQAEREE